MCVDSVEEAEHVDGIRKDIYDTTFFSQSSSGHTYGDVLSDEQRRAVIEYLKTI